MGHCDASPRGQVRYAKLLVNVCRHWAYIVKIVLCSHGLCEHFLFEANYQLNKLHRVARYDCRKDRQTRRLGNPVRVRSLPVAVYIGVCVHGAIRSLGKPGKAEHKRRDIQKVPQDVSQNTDDD